MNNYLEEKERHRKAMALIVCLFLGLLYMEAVWKPYFYGPQGSPLPAPAVNGTTAPQGPKTAPVSERAAGQPASLPAADQSASAPESASSEYPSDAQLRDGGSVVVETKAFSLKVSLLGGRASELLLNSYAIDAEHAAERLDLINHTEHAPYPLGVYNAEFSDAWTKYAVVSGPGAGQEGGIIRLDAREQAETVLVLKGVFADGRGLTKRLTFYPEGYLFKVAVTFDAPGAGAQRLMLEWTRSIEEGEASLLDPYNIQGYTWFDGQQAARKAFGDMDVESLPLNQVQWASLGDKYFVAALLSERELAQGLALKTGSVFRVRLAGDEKAGDFTVIAGPKKYEYLEKIGFELRKNIDFGKFGIVSIPLLSLLHALNAIFSNYGLAIVLLTIGVKLALYPLNATSYRQMKAMQDLRPEMDRIRKQVTDKQQQQVELMALYKKKGVNPLGGCLPVLLQMPIFIGLYSALMLAVELRGAPFAVWIVDLSAPETLMIAGVGIPVLVVLFAAAMAIQQWTTPSTMDPAQKKMMMFMPIFMGFLFAKLPAGLTLYMLTNTLISIGQQKGMYYSSEKGQSALKITLVVSSAVFVAAYLVTLI